MVDSLTCFPVGRRDGKHTQSLLFHQARRRRSSCRRRHAHDQNTQHSPDERDRIRTRPRERDWILMDYSWLGSTLVLLCFVFSVIFSSCSSEFCLFTFVLFDLLHNLLLHMGHDPEGAGINSGPFLYFLLLLKLQITT